MQFAHAGNNRLAGLFVRVHPKRRVLFGQLLQRHTHFFLINRGTRLDRNGNHRLRELHAFERNNRFRVSQRVAGCNVFQTNGSGDISSPHFLDLLTVVGVHLQYPADALLLALDRVVNRVT